VALVEFALVLPVLLLSSLVTTEFGRAIYQYNTIVKSVRDAARYLSVQTPGTHTAEARNLVVYGNIAGTGNPLAPGLTLAQVPQPTWQTAGANPLINTVTVQVDSYVFHPMLGSVLGIAFANVPYNNISATIRSPL
jgi:Flp pilus assembly protein TadG